MKKIILIFLITFLLSSCGTLEKKNNSIVKEDSKLLVDNIDNKEIDNILKKLHDSNNLYKDKEYVINLLNKLDNIREDSFYVLYAKGYANEILGNYEKALYIYNKSLNTKGLKIIDKVIILNQIGHVYDLKGSIQKANEFYGKGEKLDNNFIGILVNRGRVEYRKGNYDLAKKYFLEALNGKSDSFLKSEIYFNLSMIFQKEKDGLDDAIKYANKGIKIEENYPNNYLSLGISYIIKGENYFSLAKKNLEEAIRIYPNHSWAYKYLGIIAYIENDFNTAIKNFKLQLEKIDKDVILMGDVKIIMKNEALYDLARSYALKGDAKNAIFYLEKVLNGENKNIYYSFLRDFSSKNNPFKLIENNKIFRESLLKFLKIYGSNK